MAASLIDRLPADKRSRALQLLSRNANAPGAGSKQSARSQARFAKRAGELGIFLIESRLTGALGGSIGGVNPPGVPTVSILSAGSMTPVQADITTSELDAVTWATGGTFALSIAALPGVKGEAVVVVT